MGSQNQNSSGKLPDAGSPASNKSAGPQPFAQRWWLFGAGIVAAIYYPTVGVVLLPVLALTIFRHDNSSGANAGKVVLWVLWVIMTGGVVFSLLTGFPLADK